MAEDKKKSLIDRFRQDNLLWALIAFVAGDLLDIIENGVSSIAKLLKSIAQLLKSTWLDEAAFGCAVAIIVAILTATIVGLGFGWRFFSTSIAGPVALLTIVLFYIQAGRTGNWWHPRLLIFATIFLLATMRYFGTGPKQIFQGFLAFSEATSWANFARFLGKLIPPILLMAIFGLPLWFFITRRRR